MPGSFYLPPALPNSLHSHSHSRLRITMNRQLLSLLPLLLQTLLLVLPLPLAQGGSGQVDTSGFPEVWYCDKNKRCGMIQQQPWLDRPPDERLGIGSELVDVDPDGGYHMLIE